MKCGEGTVTYFIYKYCFPSAPSLNFHPWMAFFTLWQVKRATSELCGGEATQSNSLLWWCVATCYHTTEGYLAISALVKLTVGVCRVMTYMLERRNIPFSTTLFTIQKTAAHHFPCWGCCLELLTTSKGHVISLQRLMFHVWWQVVNPGLTTSCFMEGSHSHSSHTELASQKQLASFVLFWHHLLWNKPRTDVCIHIVVLMCSEFLHCFWLAVITPCKEHVAPSEWFHQHVAHDQLPRLSLGSCCVVHLGQHSLSDNLTHFAQNPSVFLLTAQSVNAFEMLMNVSYC